MSSIVPMAAVAHSVVMAAAFSLLLLTVGTPCPAAINVEANGLVIFPSDPMSVYCINFLFWGQRYDDHPGKDRRPRETLRYGQFRRGLYGFVDQMPESFTTTLRLSLSCETSSSAKSSACITLSGLPSVSFSSMAISVATVLGVMVKTRILDFRTSSISDS